jgi:hypothetical protein
MTGLYQLANDGPTMQRDMGRMLQTATQRLGDHLSEGGVE